MNYFFHIYIMIMIYITLALGLNLLVGYTGLISLCHAAFFGLGAYVSALLMMHLHLPFAMAFGGAILAAALLSLMISLPSIKLRGDFFILVTFAFQVIVYDILYNWSEITGGSIGLSQIPRPSFLGISLGSVPSYAIFATALGVMGIGLVTLLIRSPFGRVLEAIREDELAAVGLGKNITSYKILVFMFAAGITAAGGSFYAHYITYIDPTSFGLGESIFILTIIIIGGLGNLKGPIFGAILLVLLPEVLRVLDLPEAVAASLRQMIYGLLLILFILLRPQGILGKYRVE